MTTVAIAEERARRDPGAPCIADERQNLDNAAFARTVSAVAALLAEAGLGPGDVLAVMLPNRVELVTSMFAAWRLGAAVTPVNPASTAHEARYQLDDAGARVVVVDESAGPELDGHACKIVSVAEVSSPGQPETPVAVQAGPGALALLIYTSGTTGRPKGVMLDHANIMATAELIAAWLEMGGDARSLVVLPLFHVDGIMTGVLSPLLAGGSAFIAGRFHVTTFWETVGRVRPTYFSAVPTIFALLASRDGGQPDTAGLRFAICGAAPMPRELIGEFERRYGVPVIEGYGMSESSSACTLNPLRGLRKEGSVGLPLPGIVVGVVGEQDKLLPTGQDGEVVVRGPNVMRGYKRRAQETAQALRGGWLHTGDVGQFDDDGYLTLVGRLKEVIIRGGENIYPREVEDVLDGNPAVLEAAVVGKADAVYGEQPVAFVALRTGFSVTADELIEQCRRSLARYKVPREIHIEKALPKDAVGKIAKRVLRERLERSGY